METLCDSRCQFWSTITRINPNTATILQLPEDKLCAITLLNRHFRDHNDPNQSQCIKQNMTFASLDLLSRIEALFTCFLPHPCSQGVMNSLPQPLFCSLSIIPIDRLPSCGSNRHAQPLRTMYNIALISFLKSIVLGRPFGSPSGNNALMISHLLSCKSVG